MWSKLKKLRKRRGYSCKQVAEILHTATTHIGGMNKNLSLYAPIS